MLIVGEKEEAGNKVAIRKHSEGDKGVFSIEEFISIINKEIETRMIPIE